MAAPSVDARFRVQGMDCAACATKVERATRRVPGVEDVSVSVTAGSMTAKHSPATVLSRSTTRNILLHLVITLGLKAFFLVTTVMGIIRLWPAILADTGATVLVTADAMRLLAWRGIEK